MADLPPTREVRLYIADKDIFITNEQNRIIQSRFIHDDPKKISDYDLHYVHHGELGLSGIVYSPGTAVIPVDNHEFYRRERAKAEGEDVDNWTILPQRKQASPKWLSYYGEAYPIIKAVKLLPLEDYRRAMGDFFALKAVEESRLERGIQKIREGRNKSLDTLADYLKNILETALC